MDSQKLNTTAVNYGLRAAVLTVLFAAVLAPTAALGWLGDHFDGDVSGQAVYESMAIHAEAIHRGDMTYVVYQGANLDPYVVSYDHSDDTTPWAGPFKIAENPLSEPTRDNPVDTHGAPAVFIDGAGYMHVFYGAHASYMRRSRTSLPLDDPSFSLASWQSMPYLPPGTYPQVLPAGSLDTTHSLFYRVDSGEQKGGWVRSVSATGATWSLASELETVVAGDEDDWSWYANFARGSGDRIHAAMISQYRGAASPFVRFDVFYMYRDVADGSWKDVTGSVISTAGGPPPDQSVLESAGLEAKVFGDGGVQNQVVVADNTEGDPGLLFIDGEQEAQGPDSYMWTFARWGGSSWVTATIAPTDHFMDSGTLEYESSMTVRAYLTREGTRGEGTPEDLYIDRGGDIEVWVSTDGGVNWVPDTALAPNAGKIAVSDPDTGIVYNDPQVVHVADGTPETEARLLFCEWDNDAGKMVHRVFLWGEDGYRQKEFFPDVERIDGPSRYEVAAGLAEESFPLSSDAIVIASGAVFSDALAGVPLANSLNAPILLVGKDYLPPAAEAQIKRLYKYHWFYGYDVVILGGYATISPEVQNQIEALAPQARIRRIAGADRYAVSANIADELESREGTPTGMVYASGLDTKAGDALSVSPLAAVKGWPILLTQPTTLSAQVKAYVDRSTDSSVVIVGGEASIAADIYVGDHPSLRLAGYDRYATSAAIARFGLDGYGNHAPSLMMRRYALASGEVFSDALPGGVVAARMRGPLYLTQHDQLPAPTRKVLEDKAYRVDMAYVLGGVKSVEPTVVADMVTILQDRQHLNAP